MITDEEFRRISVYMKDRYGIDLSQKKVIVNGRLENYMKGERWNNFHEYMGLKGIRQVNWKKYLSISLLPIILIL